MCFQKSGWVVALVALALFGCGNAASINGTGEAPTPGRSAAGWQQSFIDDSDALHCEMNAGDMLSTRAPRITVQQTTIFVGYEQVGNNQNPLVARFDGDVLVWCVTHEGEGPDVRGVAITWDGADVAYVVYTVVGGGTALEGTGGWLDSYAPNAISGGGPRVSFVGRMDARSGELSTGTFVIAVQSDNKVNTHTPTQAVSVLDDGNIEFVGTSAHKPIDADGAQSMDCTDYPFDSRYVFTSDLDTLVCAESSNCISQRPCGPTP